MTTNRRHWARGFVMLSFTILYSQFTHMIFTINTSSHIIIIIIIIIIINWLFLIAARRAYAPDPHLLFSWQLAMLEGWNNETVLHENISYFSEERKCIVFALQHGSNDITWKCSILCTFRYISRREKYKNKMMNFKERLKIDLDRAPTFWFKLLSLQR